MITKTVGHVAYGSVCSLQLFGIDSKGRLKVGFDAIVPAFPKAKKEHTLEEALSYEADLGRGKRVNILPSRGLGIFLDDQGPLGLLVQMAVWPIS